LEVEIESASEASSRSHSHCSGLGQTVNNFPADL
jgi:hypothetical protein